MFQGTSKLSQENTFITTVQIVWSCLSHNTPYHKPVLDYNYFTYNSFFLSFFVGGLTSQQHTQSTSDTICKGNVMCYHTGINIEDSIYYLTQSQCMTPGQPVPELTPQHLGPVSWRMTTVKWQQFSQSNHHSTIGTRQTKYHEALPSSANVQSHLNSSFTDNGNTTRYLVCQEPMVEWRLDCEDCHHLTIVGLHDTGPWSLAWKSLAYSF